MTEIDNDKALSLFMKQQKQELPDNGFSRRVIKRLPNRERMLANLWVAFCSILSITVFFAFNGIQVLFNVLREAITTIIQTDLITIDPRSLIIALAVVIGLGIQRGCSIE